jgi:hypothetical protein
MGCSSYMAILPGAKPFAPGIGTLVESAMPCAFWALLNSS